MGHREKLIKGAKQCLYERGYGHTTARDIVEASGTNLASIGYHFGTKEALMNAAMLEAVGDWGRELERIFEDECPGEGAVQFGRTWERVIESFSSYRPALVASFEAFVQAERTPELREQIVVSHEGLRRWMAELFRSGAGDQEEGAQRALGSFYLALLNGLMIQWILDPENTPSASDLTRAICEIRAEPVTRDTAQKNE